MFNTKNSFFHDSSKENKKMSIIKPQISQLGPYLIFEFWFSREKGIYIERDAIFEDG